MKKAMVKNKKKYITFMFIPESQSEVKSLRIPTWVSKLVIISFILFVSASAVCFSALSSLRLQYEASKAEMAKLSDINNSQKIEIEKLQKDSERIKKQLEENSRMLDKVKQAVGITPSDSDMYGSDNSSYPVHSSQVISLKKESGSDMSDKIANIEYEFASLADKLEAQKQIISDSIEPINNQIAYLMAKPSIVPVNASISAGFGYRKNPFTSRGTEFHKGIDFAAHYGETVAATGDGVVIFSGWNAGYGRTVIISHGYGITTLYAHNSKLLVKQGDKVKKGQAIAKVGNTGRSTGTHLHYEVKVNGKNVNPSTYFDE